MSRNSIGRKVDDDEYSPTPKYFKKRAYTKNET
jgi:hypothetical protein